MQICKIYIKEYNQFKNTVLDFTCPDTLEPVNKICLIGSNGTGKTTLLVLINRFLNTVLASRGANLGSMNLPFFMVKIKVEQEYYYILSSNQLFEQIVGVKLKVESKIYDASIELDDHWKENLLKDFDADLFKKNIKQLHSFEVKGQKLDDLLEKIRFKNNSNDLIVFSPSESPMNAYIGISDVPKTSVNEALKMFEDVPFYHEVSEQNIKDFWQMLVYHIKNREAQQQEYENKPENLSKTKKQLLEEFEKINPQILDHIATLWNKILAKAGLEFDVENAKKPIHLNDNLKAYIQIKKTQQQIKYSELSSGIRNYIFRLGHIFSLFFNRKIDKGFLILDEPENSLFPDFLYDLIDIYSGIVLDKNKNPSTQIFMATHNPIIAAQFEPFERLILDWSDSGYVVASKGITPVGDDPNDILKNDFGLRNLMGKKGIQKWNEYLALKKELRHLSGENNGHKKDIVSKITSIGSAYNFD